MTDLIKKKYWLVPLMLAVGVFSYSWIFRSGTVDYNTEVKPLLNKRCITCHGGVRRKGGFSLMFRDDALAKTESGKPAIIPGDPDHSDFMRRLTTHDPEDRMPYHDKPLDEKEIETLRKWISEGANYGTHWAYAPVKAVPVPKPRGAFFGLLPWKKPEVARNDIDYFIQDRLAREEMKPSAEAAKEILLRRVAIDLTGLPAPASLSRKFMENRDPTAYEQLVDSLLALPQYGERWTAMWMDLARYADTKGYERDDNRSIWRYRDWLIHAFNADKPYNTFLTEQLAGDLLPGATNEQFIATAFHRNTMTNDEGGTENEEFRTAAIIDRVNTTWETLMGTTFTCVQCHGHPYDPFRHDEYYRFMAFFNNTRDEDTYADYPLLREYHGLDSARYGQVLSFIRGNAAAQTVSDYDRFLRTGQPAINSLVADSFANAELADTKWLIMRKNSAARIRRVGLTGKTHLLFRCMTYTTDGKLVVRLDSAKGRELFHTTLPGTNGQWKLMETDIPVVSGSHDIHLEFASKKLDAQTDNGAMFDWFWFNTPFPGMGQPGYDSTHRNFLDLVASDKPTTTPVMMDNPQELFRPTQVFVRGNWLVKGETVTPAVPHSLNAFPKGAPMNRLGLAQWMTSTENPLTARTLVNRLWAQLFGQGLAETLEDLGTQGMPPTHRELLDYLAYGFMHNMNWSVKSLLKEMVMSGTYRQDSRASQDMLQKDPQNRLYARGPRVRLDAEQLRDQALAVSGLLSLKMYGPSVMPYQPAGIWLSPWNGQSWQQSEGNEQYRRSIYTYWKRTSPYPAMLTFDGSAREVCLARRIRTNTPLQALTLLNDSAMLVASRQLAYAMGEPVPGQVKAAIARGYHAIMGRAADDRRLAVLEKLYGVALDRYRKDPAATCAINGLMDRHDTPGTAAMIVVAGAMLNLDEFITKN
jgi:hypothetical protein